MIDWLSILSGIFDFSSSEFADFSNPSSANFVWSVQVRMYDYCYAKQNLSTLEEDLDFFFDLYRLIISLFLFTSFSYQSLVFDGFWWVLMGFFSRCFNKPSLPVHWPTNAWCVLRLCFGICLATKKWPTDDLAFIVGASRAVKDLATFQHAFHLACDTSIFYRNRVVLRPYLEDIYQNPIQAGRLTCLLAAFEASAAGLHTTRHESPSILLPKSTANLSWKIWGMHFAAACVRTLRRICAWWCIRICRCPIAILSNPRSGIYGCLPHWVRREFLILFLLTSLKTELWIVDSSLEWLIDWFVSLLNLFDRLVDWLVDCRTEIDYWCFAVVFSGPVYFLGQCVSVRDYVKSTWIGRSTTWPLWPCTTGRHMTRCGVWRLTCMASKWCRPICRVRRWNRRGHFGDYAEYQCLCDQLHVQPQQSSLCRAALATTNSSTRSEFVMWLIHFGRMALESWIRQFR